jgi:hypothetical protein
VVDPFDARLLRRRRAHADLAVAFWPDDEPLGGLQAIAFLLVLAICGFSMWRVWSDERRYGY